ncbi:MAG: aldehyde dehydrogenase family protein [Bacteroidales bacterium]|nr:aldehyde dehydrogenase family protein [Bacteroidales bacterium]
MENSVSQQLSISVSQIVLRQREYFLTNETRSIDFRLKQLKKLKQAVEKYSDDIYEALWKDLHKCKEEAFLTELSIVINEINDHIKHLKKWAKPKKVKTPLYLMPSKSYVMYEPFGLALIIAPWNYPFHLMFAPLVGAISSGCCAVLKPSPYSQYTSEVMQMIIDDTFDKEYITMIQGHRDVNQALLAQKFDFIFYTGSPDMGRVVMEAASKNLTPVVLELGGKSPCVVDKDCNVDFAARRIVWGKTINAGQTCVAPDYMFVHKSVRKELIAKMIEYVEKFYGMDSQESEHYCRIINEKAYDRLVSYLDEGKIIYGGKCDADERYIQFTLLDLSQQTTDNRQQSWSMLGVMKDEIFGPILPVIEFDDIDVVKDFVVNRPKPLAFYYFGNDENAFDILEKTTSGGVCINDTILHVGNDHLPFGGVGESGMGKYHSQESFLAFSNKRAVLKSSSKIDFAMKYPPYDKIDLIKKLM